MPRPRRSSTNYAAASDKAPAAKKSANPPKKSSVKAESKNTVKKEPSKRRLSAEVLEERADKAAVHWEDCFKDLVKFHKKHGHSLVPKIYPDNQKLAYWVQRNRKHYKLFNAKQKSFLYAERIKRLEKLDFIFVARGAEIQSEIEKKKKREKGIAKWNRHFKELKQYKAKNGDCLVPKCFEENRALASWVYNQRFQFKKLNEGADVPLDEGRIKKLNAIGFCWKAKTNEAWRESDRVRRREKSQDGWDEKFEALVDFKKKHGHTCVPKTYKPDQPLSSWVFRMRRQYGFRLAGKINNMSDDRLERLQKIGFQFRVRPLKGRSKADLKFKALAAKSRPSRSTPRSTSRSKKESVKEESSNEEGEKVKAEAEAEEEDENSTSTSAGSRTRFPRNAKAIASALIKTPPNSMKRVSKRKVKNETEEDDRKMPAKPDPVDNTENAEGERPRRATKSRAAKSSNVDSMETAVTITSSQTKRKTPRNLKRKSPASKPEQEPKKKSKVTSPSKAASKKPGPTKPQPMEIGSSPVVSTRTTRTSLATRASETKDSKEKMEKTTKPADVPPPKTRTSPRRSKENQKESTEVIQEKPITKKRRSPRVSLQKPALEPTKPTTKTSTSKAKVPSKKSKDESMKKTTAIDKKEAVPNDVTSTETPKRNEPLRRSSRNRSVDANEQIPPAAAPPPPAAEPTKRTRPTRQAALKGATMKTDISSKKKNTNKVSAKKPATKPSKTTAAKNKTPEPKTKAKPEPAKPEPKKKGLVYESEEESDDEYDTVQQYMVSPREEKRKEKKQKKFIEKQKIYIFSDSESEGFSDDDSSVEGTTKRYYSGDEYERSDDEGMS